jgi:GNAT superfamily N-acetyltransferase
MTLIRTGYEQQFEEIRPGDSALGRACVLPWDTDIFGFPVAVYQIGTDQLDAAQRIEFGDAFLAWARHNQVSLCACTIPAGSRFWKSYLPELEFRFVDFLLRPFLNGLQTAPLPQARSVLRSAQRGDWEAIEAIAAQSFRHGRYHADPVFPPELADLRYRRWIRNALTGENAVDRVYVMGEPGSVQGFYHVTVEGDVSDLRLAALKPELRGTLLGFDLYVSMLQVLKSLGVRRVITSISAGNTAVMNVYSMLGFRLSEPEIVYHWHAERPSWDMVK